MDEVETITQSSYYICMQPHVYTPIIDKVDTLVYWGYNYLGYNNNNRVLPHV